MIDSTLKEREELFRVSHALRSFLEELDGKVEIASVISALMSCSVSLIYKNYDEDSCTEILIGLPEQIRKSLQHARKIKGTKDEKKD